MLTVVGLMHQACETTGLDDFGDRAFADGLERLIEGLNGEARLSELGAFLAEREVLTSLENRLAVTAWVRDHPEVEDERVERPIVIIGMPRSGTTALSHLLGKDPALRSLLRYEALQSVPPPSQDTFLTDQRYLRSVEADEMSEAVFPGFRAIHHDPPDAPVECNTLLAHEFASTVFTTVFHLPGYLEWMMSSDLTSAYASHERLLKLLQSRRPGRWNLKGPQHGFALETLRERYPDAVLIATHRDPAVCAASTASLMSFLHAHTSTTPRPFELGASTSGFIERCAEGLVADYTAHRGDDRMLHVAYRDLVRDPIGTIHRLYEDMDVPLSRVTEAAMTSHVRSRTQYLHGVHHYAAEDFGLDPAMLDDRYRFYRDAFDVEVELRP